MGYKYKPKTKKELIEAIEEEIYYEQGKRYEPNWQADLNCIDTSLITDMSYLFSKEYKLDKFNGDISNWNASNVTNMESMFKKSKFNGDINNWDVSKVENMAEMFSNSIFNQNISKWNVSNVKNMEEMFNNSVFNQDISNWDVSNATNMKGMFKESKFNQSIGNWNVSNVEDMSWMFNNSHFNKGISKWDVSNVKNMEEMFSGSKFNKPLNNWNIRNVTNMKFMFFESKFNQDISKWNFNKRCNLYSMLSFSEFNKDIGNWPQILKDLTGLQNISVSDEYSKLPDEIKYPQTMANIFSYMVLRKKDEKSFMEIMKNYLTNKGKSYQKQGYKPDIVKKLISKDISDVMEKVTNQKAFLKTLNKKNSDINFKKLDF